MTNKLVLKESSLSFNDKVLLNLYLRHLLKLPVQNWHVFLQFILIGRYVAHTLFSLSHSELPIKSSHSSSKSVGSSSEQIGSTEGEGGSEI